MKYFFAWVAFFALATILIPFVLNMSFSNKRNESLPYDSSEIQVYFHAEDKTRTMKSEEYIRGVIMAEMPAEFEVEALKAQAVAARSYMVVKAGTSASDGVHPQADVCTDSAHCQAYIKDTDAKDKWGKNADLYLKKCRKAVEDTAGIVAVYNGEPIRAVFHAISGGRTENAADVWSGGVAYLTSVPSPGEEEAPKYKTTVEFTMNQFKSRLRDELGITYKEGTIGRVVRTEGGMVKRIEISGKEVKGTEIRRVFGLNSANFEIKTEDDIVIFSVTGYGHGVGMSQYGANYCAKQGMDYREILCKYYSGISFAKLDV